MKPSKGSKRGRREVKSLGAPFLIVREVIERQTIDQMPRRVARRIRSLQLRHADIAKRMGVSGAVLSDRTHGPTMSLAFFQRLCVALEADPGDDFWSEPLPPIMTAEDGAQLFIAKALERSKKLAGKS